MKRIQVKTSIRNISSIAIVAVVAMTFGCGQRQSSMDREFEREQKELAKAAERQTTYNNINALKSAIGLYELDTGEFPKAQQWPGALLTNPGVTGWKGPYLEQKNCLTDAWGTPISYEGASGHYSLRSAGPDKQFGSSDDITE